VIKLIYSYLDKIVITVLTLEVLKSWKRVSCIITILGGFQFILLTFIAMIFYPGGYSFTENYFSNLGTTVTETGSPNNISRILFLIACVVVGASLIPFWTVLTTLFSKSKLTYCISLFGSSVGIASALCLMGVGIFAEDTQNFLHSTSARMFFICIMIAILTYSFVILLNSEYPNIYSFLGVAFSISSILFLYIFRYSTQLSVVMQKIIVYGFCFWAVLQILRVWKKYGIPLKFERLLGNLTKRFLHK
jgi:hypothetical membrane protein